MAIQITKESLNCDKIALELIKRSFLWQHLVKISAVVSPHCGNWCPLNELGFESCNSGHKEKGSHHCLKHGNPDINQFHQRFRLQGFRSEASHPNNRNDNWKTTDCPRHREVMYLKLMDIFLQLKYESNPVSFQVFSMCAHPFLE